MKKRRKYSKCRKSRRQICLRPLRVWISCPRLVYSRKWTNSLRSTLPGAGGINFVLVDGRGPGLIRWRPSRGKIPVSMLLIGTTTFSSRQMNKKELIRYIQEQEGNIPCFKTDQPFCDQDDCCWRSDCTNQGRRYPCRRRLDGRNEAGKA